MAKENVNAIRADLVAKGILQAHSVQSNFRGRAVNKGVSRLNAILARRESFHVAPMKQIITH
jgi:hypothetical protein